MSTAPTNTVMLAVALIALTLAFVARVWTERQRSVGGNRNVQPLGKRVDFAPALDAPNTRQSTLSERRSAERRLSWPRAVAAGASDVTRFSRAWNELQSRFVDNPRAVVAEADHLVRELLEHRGYSLEESVDHPAVVTTYLAAQAITARDGRSEADTEALRKAVIYYRGLFNELLLSSPAERGGSA